MPLNCRDIRLFLLGAISAVVFVPFSLANAQSGFTVISTNDYIDSIGFFHIVGELRNDSDRVARFIELTATLYDNQDVVVGRPFGYAQIDVMRPGERSAFHLIFGESSQIEKIASYKISIDSVNMFVDKPRNLELKVGDGYLDDIGFYHQVGEVTNNGDRTASFVEVSAAFYDGDGKIVDAAFGYTSPSEINPGQTHSFEIISLSPNGHLIRSTSVNADSNEYANVPEFPITIVALVAGTVGTIIAVGRFKSYKR